MKISPLLSKFARPFVTCCLVAFLPIASHGSTVLDSATMSESDVRTAIESASPGSVFFIKGTAGWTLTERLDIPAGVTLIGSSFITPLATFKRGFNDTAIATVKSDVTLYGIVFDGNKANFTGGGVVAGSYIPDPGNPSVEILDPAGAPVLNQQWTRVIVRNCSGDAYTLSSPHQNSNYLFCRFDDNAAGIVHGPTSTGGHTQNFWSSLHFDGNTDSCVIFQSPVEGSVWEKCELLLNDWIAFESEIGSGNTSYGVIVKDSCIRDSTGPLWMNRSGTVKGLIFEDCRVKHTSDTSATSLGVTGRTGMIYVQSGRISVELRGGAGYYNNGDHFFVKNLDSEGGNRVYIMRPNYPVGRIFNPGGVLISTDSSQMPALTYIKTSAGYALDPVSRTVVAY